MKSRGAVIRFQHGVKGLGKEGTVELVDECDSLVLDAADMFISKRAKVGTLIGFTATPLKASTTSFLPSLQPSEERPPMDCRQSR